MKKRILTFSIVATVLLLYKYYQESKDLALQEESPIEVKEGYSRKPASIKKIDRKDLHADQVRFNQQYPPPQKNRSVAALIDQFENFEQVKKSYRIHNHQLQIGSVLLHESDFLTYPDDGSFDQSLGEIIKSVNGYVVYLPKDKEKVTSNNHLYIDQLTWQPTIITGKLFVKYPNGQSQDVATKLKELGHQVTFHHENIRRYEVQVKDRKKTNQFKREIASSIPGSEVDLELKSYEHTH